MDLDILGLRRLSDENVRENHRYGKENDDDNQALAKPTLGFTHPGNALILHLLRAHRVTVIIMMVRHVLFQDIVEEGGEGDEDTGGGEREVGGGTDTGVTGLHLVGLYIDDVILL